MPRLEILQAIRERPLVSLSAAYALGELITILWTTTVPLFAVLSLFVGSLVLYMATRRAVWLYAGMWSLATVIGSARYLECVTPGVNDIARSPAGTHLIDGRVSSDVIMPLPNSGREAPARFTVDDVVVRSANAPRALTASFEAGERAFGGIEVMLSAPMSGVTGSDTDRSIPRYGDRIRMIGRIEPISPMRNPGGFDERSYLYERGVHAALTVRDSADWQVYGQTEYWPDFVIRCAYRIRHAIAGELRRSLDSSSATMMEGLLLGDRSGLPPDFRDDLERTGAAHVLSTGGLQIGILVFFTLSLLRRLTVRRSIAVAAALLVVLSYVPITGERTAVIRAALIAAVFLIGELIERATDFANALALAALILLFADPTQIQQRGFVTSFCIAITIVVMMPLLEILRELLVERLASRGAASRRSTDITRSLGLRCVSGVAESVLIACAAQLGAIPLVAYFDNLIPVTTLITNILVLPCLAATIVLGSAAVIVGAVCHPLAVPLFKAVDLLLMWIVAVIRFCSKQPFAPISVSSPSPIVIVLWYGGLWIGVWRLKLYMESRRAARVVVGAGC